MQCSLELDRCFNCGIRERKGFTVHNSNLSANHQNILSQWTGHHFEDAKVCCECITMMEKCENDQSPERQFGHTQVCVGCGKSTLRKSTRIRSSDFLEVLFPWCKQFREVKTGKYMSCEACHSRVRRKIQKAEKEALDVVKPQEESELFAPKSEEELAVSSSANNKELQSNQAENQSSSEFPISLETNKAIFHNNFLTLTKYSRAAINRYKCVVPKCNQKGRTLSSAKRKLILKQSDIFLHRRVTLCEDHKRYEFHEKLDYRHFSLENIEDMLSMMEKQTSIINFDCINDMPEHICKYWTGLTVEQFKHLYEKLNIDTGNAQSLKNALAAHLLRKITGDSIVRLANLFLMSTTKLSKHLQVIEQSYVKYNLQNNGIS